MYDMFISHSAADKAWVYKLANRISGEYFQGRQLRVWFDEWAIKPGDYILDSLELGIEKSRFIAIVLTPDSVKSDWVKLERIIFQTSDPLGRTKKLIPLLLRDCEIPPALKAVKYIDFRDARNFERAFSELVKVLRASEEEQTEEVERTVSALLREAIASQRSAGIISPTQAKDRLYSYIAGLDIEDINSEGLAVRAFESMLDFKPEEDKRDYYDALMIAAECLAALLLDSVKYDGLAQKCYMRDDVAGKMVVVRAYSKVAEIAPGLVNTSGLLHCSIELDGRVNLTTEEEVLKVHISRAVGKIRNTEDGQELAEALARRGPVSRWIVAWAIGTDYSHSSGPIYHLTVTKERDKHPTFNDPPTPRLLKILAKLSKDSDATLRKEVRHVKSLLHNSWPELAPTYNEYEMLAEKSDEDGDEESASSNVNQGISRVRIDLTYSYGTPFGGRFLTATKTNWEALLRNLKSGTVVFIKDPREVLEVCFSGASGLLFYNPHGRAETSHQSTRLVGAGIPFADLKTIPNIPDGTFVMVDEGGLYA
jgi:hypothetical protein